MATVIDPGRRVYAPISLRILSLYRGSCFPCFLEGPRATQKALAAIVQEANMQGASGDAGLTMLLHRVVVLRGCVGAEILVSNISTPRHVDKCHAVGYKSARRNHD